MKIVTIIGARPQIIKAAALSRVIKDDYSDKINEVIVHTGQHYDEEMSGVFFKELGIPEPDYNLAVGSKSHGRQTADMIIGIEEILLKEMPTFLVVYGDTNSTLAGAVAASKLHIPIVHIEAGLRSFNKGMPEEVNRIVCDHVSTILFAPTDTSIMNLRNEGFKNDNKNISVDSPGIFNYGDIMLDNSLYFSDISDKKSSILAEIGVMKNKFVLCTIHRNTNTDSPERLSNIVESLVELSRECDLDFVLPIHPRTKSKLGTLSEELNKKLEESNVKIIPPVSFLDMIKLEKEARIIITDSGGVQKEAYFFEKPCLILRNETEWVEIIESGTALLADAELSGIKSNFHKLLETDHHFPKIFGRGDTAKKICEKLLSEVEISRRAEVKDFY